jgi:hypothetical protein
MENQKHNLKTFNTTNGKFILVDPLSIASVEEIDKFTVRIVLKAFLNGENISYLGKYDYKTIYSLLSN